MGLIDKLFGRGSSDSLKEELQERYAHVEETPFSGSYQDFQRAMETFIEENGGTLIFNANGSITSVSPTGEKLTMYYQY